MKSATKTTLLVIGQWMIFAAILVAMALNLLFTVPSIRPSLFRGYCTVYYHGKIPLTEVSKALQEVADVSAVVSRETAQVLYTDFSGFARVPVAKIEERFDPLDPRADDYGRRIGRYFSVERNGTTWDILYVATRRNPFYLSLVLKNLVPEGEGEWFIHELDRHDAMIFITASGTIFFLFLMLLSKKTMYRILLFLGVLPWVYALAKGGIFDFLLFFFVAFYWARFLPEFIRSVENELLRGWRDPDRRSLSLQTVLYAGIILFTFFVTSFYKTDLIEITVALLSQVMVCAAYAGILFALKALSVRFNKSFWRFYHPVEILRALRPEMIRPLKKPIHFHIVILILCLLPVTFMFRPSGGNISLPMPLPRGTDKAISLSGIRELAALKTESSLPDLSDFVRHAAYQERLNAGLTGDEIPAENDQLTISGFRLNESTGEIEKTPRVLVKFDSGWLHTLTEVSGASSIERMLFNQGECVTVSMVDSPPQDFFSESAFTILIVWCIVLCPVLLLYYTTIPQKLYGIGREFIRTMRNKS